MNRVAAALPIAVLLLVVQRAAFTAWMGDPMQTGGAVVVAAPYALSLALLLPSALPLPRFFAAKLASSMLLLLAYGFLWAYAAAVGSLGHGSSHDHGTPWFSILVFFGGHLALAGWILVEAQGVSFLHPEVKSTVLRAVVGYGMVSILLVGLAAAKWSTLPPPPRSLPYEERRQLE